MENKDEESLEAVEGCKQIRHDNCLLADEQNSKHPGQAQKNHQDGRPLHPGPAKNQDSKYILGNAVKTSNHQQYFKHRK